MYLLQFTGLSGAGKSTIAQLVKQQLEATGQPVAIVDGDVYRQTLCRDLGFSPEDRAENIRRLAAAANDFVAAGKVAIIAAINPYEHVRQSMTRLYNAKTIWLHCPLDTLFERDTKGLYKRTTLPDGHPEKIANLTGVNDPFETPQNPSLVLYTAEETPEQSAERVIAYLKSCDQ